MKHTKTKIATEEEVRLYGERIDAEIAYFNYLLKGLASRRGVEESKVCPSDVDYIFGRRNLLREIMSTIKGVDPKELSWDEVESEFQRVKNTGGEYGEGLDAENVELCEKVNQMRAELAKAEEFPGEDEEYLTDYNYSDYDEYDSDSDW